MRALSIAALFIVACGSSTAPAPGATASPPATGPGLTHLRLTTTHGSSGNERSEWDATPTNLKHTEQHAGEDRNDLSIKTKGLDAAAWDRLRAAVAARKLGAVVAEPDACGGGTAHRVELTFADGSQVIGWRHCNRGSLTGDLDGLLADLAAMIGP